MQFYQKKFSKDLNFNHCRWISRWLRCTSCRWWLWWIWWLWCLWRVKSCLTSRSLCSPCCLWRRLCTWYVFVALEANTNERSASESYQRNKFKRKKTATTFSSSSFFLFSLSICAIIYSFMVHRIHIVYRLQPRRFTSFNCRQSWLCCSHLYRWFVSHLSHSKEFVKEEKFIANKMLLQVMVCRRLLLQHMPMPLQLFTVAMDIAIAIWVRPSFILAGQHR